MRVYVEKKEVPANIAHYFVIDLGNKQFSIETNAAKTLALIWVFFALCFVAFMAGKELAYTETMVHAYLLKGDLKTEDGKPVECEPRLSDNKRIVWVCQNLEK